MRMSQLVRRASDEQGATVIFVGISLTMIFGFTALAIDAGNLWQSRRHVIIATDAAALAAAQVYAEGGDGCTDAPGWVAANDSNATMTSCVPGSGSTAGSGYVTVQASTPVDYWFAPVIGVNSRTVSSSTTAAYGYPSSVTGLRPFGLCLDHPVLKAWLDAGARDDGTVHRVLYSKDSNDDCGDAPGNWAELDMNGGSNSNSEFQDWVEHGYDGEVSVSSTVEGDTGSFNNSLNDELTSLLGERFTIVVFSNVVNPGANAQFTVYGFLTVTLHGFQLTGAQADRYFDVEFHNLTVSGTCCSSGPNTGAKVVFICAVDPGELSGCP